MILGSIRDISPVVLVIAFFQIVVLRQPAGELLGLIEGVLFVLVGLTLFVYGLELALFPVGEALAYELARKGSFILLLVFAFLLGFGTTLAEPALTAVASEAARTAAGGGTIPDTDAARTGYALGLRVTVALAVGFALTLGVTRIVLAWSLPVLVIAGYALVLALSFVAPPETLGIAYDSGGVTTSVITVPLVTALGIGLASSIAGRNPMSDGFGMLILVLITPAIFVLAYGTLLKWIW
jgi:hypothetical protein